MKMKINVIFIGSATLATFREQFEKVNIYN
jgi:hypothetical protein